MSGVPASATQLADAVRAIAEREGIDVDQLTAYVDVDGECRHGVVLWAGCPACGRPGVPDAVAQEVDAHIDRLSGRYRAVLTVADVAALRGVSEATVRSYRVRYPEGHPNAFPVALESTGGPVLWDARLRPALVAWRSVGQGVGGGRRPAAPAETKASGPVARVRISAAMMGHVDGTGVWQELNHSDCSKIGEYDPTDVLVCRKIMDARTDSRGGRTITVESRAEVKTLRLWADDLIEFSRDDVADGDKSALAEFNAASALLRKADVLLTTVFPPKPKSESKLVEEN